MNMMQAPYQYLTVQFEEPIALVCLNRPEKRNAISDALVAELRHAFESMPASVRAIVLHAEGEHFCAGLDLTEMREVGTVEAMHHSRMWHAAFEQIQFGRAPVVAVLTGATIGGGLELASACHVRVAEESSFYALPEGSRGLFVGGGASVRVPRLIGVARMADMMLTGRVYDAQEGYDAGIAQYLVKSGEGLAKARELAARIAQNSPTTNYAVTQVLPRIADQSIQDGLLTESLMAAIASSDPQTQARLADFLERKIGRVQPK
jgi:(methylthio)acryloyl-CoA hydratase